MSASTKCSQSLGGLLLRCEGIELPGLLNQVPSPGRFPVWANEQDQDRILRILRSKGMPAGMIARLLPLGTMPTRGTPICENFTKSTDRSLFVVMLEGRPSLRIDVQQPPGGST